ncbi:hypothetical protein ACN47E_002406 [Coniothyrium glycines]
MAKTKGVITSVKFQHPVFEAEPPPAESFMEPASRSQTSAQRPKTSPYTAPPVALHIGPDQRAYYVPPDLLQNSTWLASSRSWDTDIHLPDVDASTGHVLVHYLYTGTYQTLNDVDTSLVDDTHVEFKRAVLAYITAQTHELLALEQLAQHEIERFGANMDIFEVVEAVSDVFAKVPGDDTWLQGYIEGKVKMAFEDDETTFVRKDLFGSIEDVKLMRVLAKCVIGLYQDAVVEMLGVGKEVFPGGVAKYIAGSREEERTEESFADEGTFGEDGPAEDFPVENFPAEDSTATASEDKFAEDDVWGSSNDSMLKNKGEKSSAALVEDPVSAPVPAPEKAKEDELPSLTLSIAVKKKKGKKKFMKKAKEEPTVSDPTSPPPGTAVSVHADLGATLVADGEINNRKKVNEGTALEEAPTSLPEPEPDADESQVTCFQGLSKMQKKKLRKALRDEAMRKEQEKEEEAAAEPESRPDDIMINRITVAASQEKQGIYGLVPASPTVSKPPNGNHFILDSVQELPAVGTIKAALAEEENINQTEGVALRIINGYSKLKAELVQPTEAEDGICPLRAKHLLEGDQWKTCQQCQALLCQVAINLVRTGHE